MSERASEEKRNFIQEIIDGDQQTRKHQGKVATRFPPEPNGYLHIGHAKSICLNFGLAQEYNGSCNLRFDDTNPSKEDEEYVRSIAEDIRWLGFDWGERELYASDYFEQMYHHAVTLIKKGKAYVDSLSAEEIRAYRGTYTEPGRESPYRNRSVEENLDLFERMRAGEFADGAHILRAKIDMSSPNMNLRDPAIYRIRKATHHRTKDEWCIYPMYDFAHGLEDSIEGITHSICTLEFEAHRPLYDWFLEELDVFHPQQIEFARLNLSYTIMSKRMLLTLVEQGHVSGWDDPRMPTISGLRRRGFSPESIRAFCERVGVAKRDGIVDVALLEHAVREHLNDTTPRVMAVLNPLKVVIENFAADETEWFDAPFHPEDPSMGSRRVPLTREIFIERDDFREDPPRKWHRLAPGREIRLRYACLIKCVEVVKDPKTDEVVELRCTWDPASRGGSSPDGRKVRGTSHWVSAVHGIKSEVRLYDRLFNAANPLDVGPDETFHKHLNPDSLQVLGECRLEPSLANVAPEERFQFERLGYFCADRHDHQSGNPVFNHTVTLRDSWARIERSQQKSKASPKKQQTGKKKQVAPVPARPETGEISIEAFAKLDLRVAQVLEASLVEGAKKLIRLQVDLGEAGQRQIFAGIRAAYPDPTVLLGKKVIVVANLKPRKMSFGMSEGMVLSGSGETGTFVATFDGDLLPGDKIS